MKKTTLLFLIITSFWHSFLPAQINLGSTVVQHTVVASNLNVPWDMAYGPDGTSGLPSWPETSNGCTQRLTRCNRFLP